jgi:adenylate kinase family enzyme
LRRILIIGSGGAGKSTLARRLGERTGIEVVHLDKLFWHPGWVRTEKEEWFGIVRQAIEKESWIIDGNFGSTLEMRAGAADTIIFMDIPRHICIYRIVKRWVLYNRGTRPDMAEGCEERFDWEFFLWVWNYPTRSKPEKELVLNRYANEKTVIRLRSNKEIEQFLRNDIIGLEK